MNQSFQIEEAISQIHTNPEQRLAIVTDLYQLHYECMYISPFCSFLYGLYFIVDVLLDKKTELLDLMMKHGIIDGLCEIFSTCQDDDTLV